MTLAVLCGSTGNDLDPGAARRLADELTAALAAAGATAVVPVEGLDVAAQLREIARIAADAAEPLLLCADNLVAHPSLLWTLATEPAGRSTALVIAEDGGDLREERGRLVAAVDGTTRFLGAISIAPADLPILATAAARAADHVPAGPELAGAAVATTAGSTGVARRDAVDVLLPGLIDGGLVPIATRVRLLHAERVHTPAELTAARAAVAAVDEDSALLRLAVKEKDDFFTTYAVSTWSPLVTKWCARLGLSPSGVTALSVLFAVAAALAFWQASRPAMIAGGSCSTWASCSTAWTGNWPGTPAASPRSAAGWTRWQTGPRSTRSTPAWPPAPSGPACRTPGRWRSPRSCCRRSGT
nr:hypothetical protein GCM10020092_103750 [Actinoplanes digitatis]